jgi:hypothetical protein
MSTSKTERQNVAAFIDEFVGDNKLLKSKAREVYAILQHSDKPVKIYEPLRASPHKSPNRAKKSPYTQFGFAGELQLIENPYGKLKISPSRKNISVKRPPRDILDDEIEKLEKSQS